MFELIIGEWVCYFQIDLVITKIPSDVCVHELIVYLCVFHFYRHAQGCVRHAQGCGCNFYRDAL